MSDVDDAKAAYLANADFDTTNDATKAKAFVVACRKLLLLLPKMSSKDGATFGLNPEMIQAEKSRAERWVSAKTAGGYRAFRLTEFRG